jgi:hypothetical protein
MRTPNRETIGNFPNVISKSRSNRPNYLNSTERLFEPMFHDAAVQRGMSRARMSNLNKEINNEPHVRIETQAAATSMITPMQSRPASEILSGNGATPRRRGRPPGSKNKVHPQNSI